jgi:hypothetical protein
MNDLDETPRPRITGEALETLARLDGRALSVTEELVTVTYRSIVFFVRRCAALPRADFNNPSY